MYITQAFVACVGFFGLVRYKSLIKPLRYLVWYIGWTIFIDGIKDVMIYEKIRTLWIDHWFSVGELLLYVLVLNFWRINKRYGFLLWCSFTVYLLVWLVGKFSFEPFEFSDTYSGSISQIIQIAFGIPLLIKIIVDEYIDWKNNPRFWALSGIVFYAAAAFILFSSVNILLALPISIMRVIWHANRVFIIIQHILFLRGFLCKSAPAGTIHQTTLEAGKST
jgi:hypothetical protein